MSSLSSTQSDAGRGCQRAELEFVVDARGVPQTGQVRRHRTNSPSLARALEEALPHVKYEPAMKDGRPVAQVVRYGVAYVVVVRTSGAAPSMTAMPRCR